MVFRTGLYALIGLPVLYLGLTQLGVSEARAGVVVAVALAGSVLTITGVVIRRELLRTQGAARGRDLMSAGAAVEDAGTRAELALRAEDPGFTRAQFFTTVTALCGRLTEAARSGSLDGLHPFLSDGLFQRLSTQRRLQGLPPEFVVFASAPPVQGMLINEYSVASRYQQVAVRLTLGGDQAITLTLVLLRRRGAQTGREGLAALKCPQCGAPLVLSATQRCEHCSAITNSGAFDWVLAGLGAGAHQLGRQGDVLDPQGLRQVDDALAPEALVDRGTLAFWRWVEARKASQPGRLTRVATPGFLATLELAPSPEGEVSAAGAELRGLRVGEAFDEAHVLIRWADRPHDEVRSHQTIFKLRRPHGLRTSAEVGLSTFRCTGCLAAVTDAESPACEFCGAPLSDAWCVHELEPFSTWMEGAVRLRNQVGGDWARAATPAQREAAFGLLVSVARADGALTPEELQRLHAVAARWQLAAGQVEAVLAGPAPVAPAFARELTASLMVELVAMAAEDGSIHPKERKRLSAVAALLGAESELERQIAAQVRARRSAR